jgi:glycine/D-amino acid oxidase-like deaminating enzyme
VLVDGSLLPADVAVIAMGPWSGAAAAWLRGKYDGSALDVTGTKYHSAVLTADSTAHCLFTNFTYASGRSVDPEVYPRPDGTVYVCGEPQSVPVPQEGPSGVTVDQALVDRILTVAGSLASGLKGAPVEAAQACFLPIPPGGGVPVIGPVPGVPGAFVATGHSCWGILNGPATGKAVAELIVDGEVSCLPGGLASFDPALFQGEL